MDIVGTRLPAVAAVATLIAITASTFGNAASDFGHRSDPGPCLNPKDSKPDDQIAACWKALNSHMLNRDGVAAALNNLAVAYRLKEDWDSALNALNAAIKLEGDTWQSLLNRGAIYDRLGKSELALADFNKAIEINATRPICFRMRGEYYLGRENFQLAADDFTRAILLDSKDAKSLYYRSLSRRHLADIAAADADLALAKQMDPNIENATKQWTSKLAVPPQ